MAAPVLLVVGSRGLLGSRLSLAAARRGERVLTHEVRWSSPENARDDLAAAARLLAAAAADGRWRVAWCAGGGVTSTRAEDLATEVQALDAFLAALGEHGRSAEARGSFFLASSAGGVYAGCAEPPFTEETVPSPLAPYGHAKLAGEAAVRAAASRWGFDAFVGRISNLYGPGQNLRKAQGLVAHLCRSHYTGQPLSVYVSLDTLRDYLYVDDCAEMILDGLDRLESEAASAGSGGRVVTKILASQRSVSVGALLAESARVFHRTSRVLVAASPHARAQAPDLRFSSRVWPELDRRTLTTLPAGIAATQEDVAARFRRGELG